MSYLHPSQRTQAATQVGPSSNSNNYHVGVLQGNWFEERYSFGPQPSSTFKFTATSEIHDQYPPRSGEDYREAKPPAAAVQEAPRSLLLGQGKPVVSMRTVAELSYTNPHNTDTVLKTNQILSAEGHSPRCQGTIGKRVENGSLTAKQATVAAEEARRVVAGETAGGPTSLNATATNNSNSNLPAYLRNTKAEAQFLTTKNVTHDAAGEYMKEHPEVFTQGKCSSRGEVMKRIDDPMSRTGFRQ